MIEMFKSRSSRNTDKSLESLKKIQIIAQN